MGNTLGSVDQKAVKKFDTFLAKYPKLLNKQLLSDNKLFKTYSFLVEGESNIMMKVYIKRDNTSLTKHELSLNYMQKIFNLNVFPNLLPYTRLINDPDFFAIIRPKVNITLSHRLQTVPTLSAVEKRWIVFQLMTAIFNLHDSGLYHGAITSSNVLLTTWDHVFLADFAWFAPNYIYEDQMGDINYYHPTAIFKCNLAPEKFISRDYKEVGSLQWFHENIREVSKETMANLQSMDIFSLGCVIAEIMLDGTSLFRYEQLLAYRRGEYSPDDKIDMIQDERVKRIIYDMIQKDPSQRKGIVDLLKEWANEVAPPSFSKILYSINSSLISQNFVLPDQRIALIRELLGPIYETILEEPLCQHFEPLPLVLQQSQILKLFNGYFQMIQPDFSDLLKIEKMDFSEKQPRSEGFEMIANIDPKDLRTIMTVKQVIGRGISLNDELIKEKKGKNQELLLIALMICSNIRNVRYLSSALVGLEMLANFSYYFVDQTNLHIIIPYLFSLFDEQNPRIVIATFNIACDILSRMTKPILYRSDRQLFEDQIFPNLLKVYNMNDIAAKSAFVGRMHQIIKFGSNFISEGLKFDYKVKKNEIQTTDETQEAHMPGDIEVKNVSDETIVKLEEEKESKLAEEINKEIRKWKLTFVTYIQEVFSSQIFEVNEMLLKNFANLGRELGPEMTENIIVPHVVAALNDNRSKLTSLREIEKLIDLTSEKTINGLLKPVLEKCMFDPDEQNVFQSVKNLNKIMKLKKLDLKDPSFITNYLLPLAIHPSAWIREQVLELICESIQQSDLATLYIKINPYLLKYVRDSELELLNAELFRLEVVDPITRRVYEEIKKGTYNSSRDSQHTKDLCAILNEYFLKKISAESDPEPRKQNKFLKKFVDPKTVRNIEEVLAHFCTETNLRQIKGLTQFNDQMNLSESVLLIAAATRDRDNSMNNSNSQLQIEDGQKLVSFSDIKKLRNDLNLKIPQYLIQHNIGHSTYIKNVHNFCLFTANILGHRLQLQKKKNKDMGYHERYERMPYLNKEWEPQGFLIKTIHEHKDPVNCLDISTNSRFVASGSEGGEIRIFDMSKIESELSFMSKKVITVKNEKLQEEFGSRSKIKTLKFLDEESLIAGTDTGILELHQIEGTGQEGESNVKSSSCTARWEVDGEIKAIQPLILGGNLREKSFIYVTHKGELGIQDIREKGPSVKFNLGKERGMISTMIASAMDYTVVIGTQRGHVLLYDIRTNLLTSMYQLSSEAPILSFANYNPLSPGAPVTSQDSLIGISFGSDYHEVGFWNFSDFNKVNKNPEIYLYSSLNSGAECSPSYLKDVTKSESVFNIRSSFSERRYYDYLAINSPDYNILSYFDDSIHQSQESQSEKWLQQSKSIYRHASTAFQYRNSAHKIVCLPTFSPRELRNKVIPAKEMQNVILTAGNDMNIRYWNLTSDKFYQVYNVDGKKRSYNCTNTGMLVYQEVFSNDPDKTGFSAYQNKNGCSLPVSNFVEKNVLAQAGHKDTINDILVAEKNEMLITCSRDKTIKIWK